MIKLNGNSLNVRYAIFLYHFLIICYEEQKVKNDRSSLQGMKNEKNQFFKKILENKNATQGQVQKLTASNQESRHQKKECKTSFSSSI